LDKRDPYVEMVITNKPWTMRTTGIKSNNHRPVWGERFHYIDYQPGDKLMFHIWDHDKITDDDHLGDVEVTPDCKQKGTKVLELSGKGHLTIMLECVPGQATSPEHMEVTMAKIAADVYDVNKKGHKSQGLDYWDLVQSFRRYGDNVAVYQKGKECTLAFTGSGLDDLVTNLVFVTTQTTACGYELHRGYWNEVKRLVFGTTEWPGMMQPFLASDNCTGGIYVVGHSLGGAVAEIFTACVNQKERWLKGKGFKVKEVYTIGALAVAKTALEQPDGCLKGARIYDEDGEKCDPLQFDPAPYLSQLAGARLVHPKLKAVQLKKTSSGVEKREFDCQSEEAINGDKKILSLSNIVSKLKIAVKNGKAGKHPWPLHSTKEYFDRLMAVLKK